MNTGNTGNTTVPRELKPRHEISEPRYPVILHHDIQRALPVIHSIPGLPGSSRLTAPSPGRLAFSIIGGPPSLCHPRQRLSKIRCTSLRRSHCFTRRRRTSHLHAAKPHFTAEPGRLAFNIIGGPPPLCHPCRRLSIIRCFTRRSRTSLRSPVSRLPAPPPLISGF